MPQHNFPRPRFLLPALLVAIVLFAPTSATAVEKTVLPDPVSSGKSVIPQFYWMEDPARTLTINEVADESFDGRFTLSNRESLGLGLSGSAFWVRFTVVNSSSKTAGWILENDHPLWDFVEFYARDENGAWTKKRAGDHVPFAEREIAYRKSTFHATIPPGAERTFFLRCYADIMQSVKIKITLWPEEVFHRGNTTEYVLLGAYFGAMAVMFFYNLFLYFAIGDRRYLWYVLYVLGISLSMFAYNGLAFQYLWPNSSYLADFASLLFGYIAYIFMALFGRSFLETRRHTPWLDLLFLLIAAVSLAGVAFCLLGWMIVAMRMLYLTVVVSSIVGVIAALIRLFQGYRPARFYLASWSAAGIGLITLSLKDVGVLPYNALTLWAPQMGTWLDVILLSFALADRINFITAERENALEKAAHMSERLQAVMDNTLAVIYVKDIDGRYITVNRQYEKLFGVTRNVIAGKTDYDIFPKEAADAFRANDAQVIATGEPLETEEEVPQKDGVHTYISIKFPLRDAVGRVYALCGISTDITDRKKAEEVLKTSHEKLENLVRARTADLMEVNEALIGARNKAEKATKAKDKFINLLSHDLKSPLSSLSLILDMLLADKANPPPENQKTLIQKAKNRMRSLVTMIEDLLRMSNIQSEGMEPKKRFWDLRSLIMHNIDAVEEMAVKKGVTVKNASPAGIQVFVDMRLITQVILNLLSNAIKFSRSGGVITVSGGLDGGAFFTVKDNGVGIDPVILPEIFNREVRTTTLGTDGEVGTGFGLPFCRDIVERHGGTIEARSVPGEGSEFTVRIPEVKFLALVVDDQEVARKAIIGQVRKLGMEALEAENGAQALSILAEVTPNLVITDLSMPEMNGFELLKKIRSGEALKSIPVIVATSSDDAESQRRAFELGADDFIAKPVSESDLLPRVKRLMERGKPSE